MQDPTRLTQMCSKPPSGGQTSAKGGPMMCSGPPTTLASTPTKPKPTASPPPATTTYTTLKHWAPVVARSTDQPCVVDVVQPAHYANATHNQGQWEAVTADAKDRETYEAYNSTDSNVHPAAERACAFPASKGCQVVGIREDGTLGGGIEACLGDGDEIRGMEPTGTQAECAAKCTADKQCAAYTYVQGRCILQNRLVVDKNPGHVLGQATIGVDTHVRNCSAWKNGECLDNPSAPSRTCHAFASMKDHHDVRECAGEENVALESLAGRNGDGGHFQLLNAMEWKTHPSRRPVTANDSSMMPVYQKHNEED